MKKTLVYTSGDLDTKRVTGGIKRFIELIQYGFKNSKNIVLCSQTNNIKLNEFGVNNHILLGKAKGDFVDKFLFPEIASIRANYRVIKQIKKQNFDNIVVFDVPPAIGLVLMGFNNIILMLRKDMIGYEIINVRHKNLKHYLKITFQWFCEALCLIRSRCIITQCHYDRNQLIKRHPFLKKNILKKTKIQINNVNPSWINKRKPDNQSNNVFRVCFIGDFSNVRKGHDLILKAASVLLNEGYNMEFIIIGDGLELEYYKRRYSSDRISFLGRLKNATEELIKSSILVVPSRADSCPNTVLEALYCGIPVIGSKAGGIPEILNNDEALFDLTVESIADKLRELYSDNNKLHKLLEKEHLRCNELEFNWAEKIFNIIESKDY